MIYQGEYDRGMKEGSGKLVQQGQHYVGEFVRDKKQGVGELLLPTSENLDEENCKRRFLGEFHDD